MEARFIVASQAILAHFADARPPRKRRRFPQLGGNSVRANFDLEAAGKQRHESVFRTRRLFLLNWEGDREMEKLLRIGPQE